MFHISIEPPLTFFALECYVSQKVSLLTFSFLGTIHLDVPQTFLWLHLFPVAFFCRLTSPLDDLQLI